jgi:hypothetical protein
MPMKNNSASKTARNFRVRQGIGAMRGSAPIEHAGHGTTQSREKIRSDDALEF